MSIRKIDQKYSQLSLYDAQRFIRLDSEVLKDD